MDDLLTAKQVQEILNIDRTTVYRMLKDGRLNGVKIGQHWRFPKEQILSIVNGRASLGQYSAESGAASFPIHCIQGLQDVFAEMAGLGSVTVDHTGKEITALSNSCDFCRLIQSSSTGLAACRASWSAIVRDKHEKEEFFICHAGLYYTYAQMRTGKGFDSFLVAGQFFPSEKDKDRSAGRVADLSKVYQIDAKALQRAFNAIPVLSEKSRQHMNDWMGRVAQTLVNLISERFRLMERLKKISEISSIE